MCRVSFVVNDYMQMQGANSVIDQFLLNKEFFQKKGIYIDAVYDYKSSYSAVPQRENTTSVSSLIVKTKKLPIADTFIYEYLAVKRENYKYGYKFYRKFKDTDFADCDVLVFQDIYAANAFFKYAKDYNTKICFLTHMYDDYLSQFKINRKHLANTFVEKNLRVIYRTVFDNCETIFTICKHAKESLSDFTSNKSIIPIYNSVSVPVIATDPGSHHKIQIVMASSVSERKGFDLLMDALTALPGNYRDKLNITVYGSGNYYDRAIDIKRDNQLDCINFLGRVQKPYLNYADKDVLMLTSRDETLPMSILEAMQLAIPILSTDVGAINEMVFPGVNGMLFEEPTAEAIRNGLIELIDQKQHLKDWGKKGKEIYNERFSLEQWVSAFSESFHAISNK